ncbi:MAG: hypothetical protein E7099_04485 [Mediterranea massiliensis]|nr:hypothetical protein [Mediterranea massiliensis]
MIFNKTTIIKNSQAIYQLLHKMQRYSYAELQRMTQLNDTDLCMAISQLLMENKVVRIKKEKKIFYRLNV